MQWLCTLRKKLKWSNSSRRKATNHHQLNIISSSDLHTLHSTEFGLIQSHSHHRPPPLSFPFIHHLHIHSVHLNHRYQLFPRSEGIKLSSSHSAAVQELNSVRRGTQNGIKNKESIWTELIKRNGKRCKWAFDTGRILRTAQSAPSLQKVFVTLQPNLSFCVSPWHNGHIQLNWKHRAHTAVAATVRLHRHTAVSSIAWLYTNGWVVCASF